MSTIRRILAVTLLALAVSTGCVVEEPPGSEFTEDLQSDFETEDYFNP